MPWSKVTQQQSWQIEPRSSESSFIVLPTVPQWWLAGWKKSKCELDCDAFRVDNYSPLSSLPPLTGAVPKGKPWDTCQIKWQISRAKFIVGIALLIFKNHTWEGALPHWVCWEPGPLPKTWSLVCLPSTDVAGHRQWLLFFEHPPPSPTSQCLELFSPLASP